MDVKQEKVRYSVRPDRDSNKSLHWYHYLGLSLFGCVMAIVIELGVYLLISVIWPEHYGLAMDSAFAIGLSILLTPLVIFLIILIGEGLPVRRWYTIIFTACVMAVIPLLYTMF